MSDLAGFLLARLAEDEAVARAATSGPWLVGDTYEDLADVWAPGPNMVTSAHDYPCCTAADAVHIARHDPARVLAEVATKRRIVALAVDIHGIIDGEWGDEWNEGDQILEALAQPYADHPDFDPAWRIDEAPTSPR